MSKGGPWFLPSEPDVVRLLREQLAITLEALDAFSEWAGGDASAGSRVRDAEDRGDTAKREVWTALRSAFVLPVEPEDVFALSRGIDWILNDAADLVAESEVLAAPPDPGLEPVAAEIRVAVGRLDEAISNLVDDADAAIAGAEATIAAERRLSEAYYRGMAELLELEDRNARIAQRELYRRCADIGDVIVDTAERVMYAVIKQS